MVKLGYVLWTTDDAARLRDRLLVTDVPRQLDLETIEVYVMSEYAIRR